MKFKRKQLFDQENIELTEQFHTVYEQLAVQGTVDSLLITSIRQKVNTVQAAAYLALAISKQGKRVLLIDANLEQPVLHQFFNFRNVSGFGELLFELEHEEQQPIDTFQITESFSFLSAGRSTYHPVSLLRLASFSKLIALWRESHDVVLFYGADYLQKPEAREIAKHCSEAVLFIHEGRDKLADVIAVKESLENQQSTIMGTVIIS